MEDLQDELQLTYLFVSHDMSVIEHICDRVAIMYLGKVLPYCTMAMLVVFCFRDTDFSSINACLPELIDVIYAVLLQKWQHNSTLTIVSATILYMLLIQRVYI